MIWLFTQGVADNIVSNEFLCVKLKKNAKQMHILRIEEC